VPGEVSPGKPNSSSDVARGACPQKEVRSVPTSVRLRLHGHDNAAGRRKAAAIGGRRSRVDVRSLIAEVQSKATVE